MLCCNVFDKIFDCYFVLFVVDCDVVFGYLFDLFGLVDDLVLNGKMLIVKDGVFNVFVDVLMVFGMGDFFL